MEKVETICKLKIRNFINKHVVSGKQQRQCNRKTFTTTVIGDECFRRIMMYLVIFLQNVSIKRKCQRFHEN